MRLFQRLLIDRWGRRDDYFDWRLDQAPLDLATLEGVCLLHLNDKLGDGLFYSLLVDALAQTRPDLPIDVISREAFGDYWASHPAVRTAHVVSRAVKPRRSPSLRQILAARRAALPLRGRFDLVVSFESFVRPEHFAFIDGLAPRRLVGFSKPTFRRFDYSLDDGRYGAALKPFSEQVLSVMSVFGRTVPVDRVNYHAPLGKDGAAKAEERVRRFDVPGPRLLFSVYGASGAKVLSPESVVRGVRELRAAGHCGPLFLSVPPRRTGDYEAALSEAGVLDGVALLGPTERLSDLFAFVSRMDGVVSIDSGVAHVAAALGKPQIVIYAQRTTIPIVWRPRNDRLRMIVPPGEENVNAIRWEDFGSAGRDLAHWAKGGEPLDR